MKHRSFFITDAFAGFALVRGRGLKHAGAQGSTGPQGFALVRGRGLKRQIAKNMIKYSRSPSCGGVD